MLLGKGGAYSKRYQSEEKERMSQWQSMTARNSRDREHILSKQTAQRQKALEQKKRAMAQAEEDRRRKALEERRRTQREATERCKMAISRLKVSSRPLTPRSKYIPVEIYYANLPQQVGKSSVFHNSTPSSSTQPAGSGVQRGGGRIVLGSQVELRPDQLSHTTGNRTAPNMDDVLKNIRGHRSPPPCSPSPAPLPPSTVHQPAPLPPSTVHRPASVQEHRPRTVAHTQPLRGSSSDSNVTTQVPVYKVHTPKGTTAVSTDPSKTEIKKASSQEGVGKLSKAEGVVFHPVMVRGPVKTRLDVSREETDAVRGVSPSRCISSSDCSPLDSLSGTSCDDANEETVPGSASTPHVATPTRRVVRKHKREKKLEISNGSRGDGSTINPSLPPAHADSDSSTEDESTPLRVSPPRSRRQRKLPPGPPTGGLQHNMGYQTSDEPRGAKIVGILKKPHSGSSVRDKEDKMCKRGENGFVSPSATATNSRGSSIASSALILERNDGNGNGYSVGGSEISRDTIMISSASTTKRVRFSDNLESSLNSSQTSVSSHIVPHPHTVAIDDTVELWKQVLPNERYPLNGLFSPRMKISLSQRGGRWALKNRQPQSSSDHITVHVPRAKGQSPPENLTTDAGLGREREVKGHECRAGNREEMQRQEQYGSDGRGLSREPKKNEQNKHFGSNHVPSQKVEDAGGGEGYDGQVVDENLSDESVTDAQIERVWDEIQQLYSKDDRVTVSPQVYKFQPAPQKGGGSAQSEGESGRGRKGGGVRHLPHRQQQRTLRCQGVVQSHTHKTNTHHDHPHQKWAGPAQQLHHQHHMIHSNSYHQSESSYVSAQVSPWEPTVTSTTVTKRGVTGLSHDEQQLIQSIKRINQRLKGHVVTQEYGHHHPPHLHPSHPPHHHTGTTGNNRRTNSRKHQ